MSSTDEEMLATTDPQPSVAAARDDVHRAAILQPNGPRPLTERIGALDAALDALIAAAQRAAVAAMPCYMQQQTGGPYTCISWNAACEGSTNPMAQAIDICPSCAARAEQVQP